MKNLKVHIYSNFITAEGLGVFIILRENIISDNTVDSITGKKYGNCSAAEKKVFKPLTYILYRIPSNKRREILTSINSDKNKHGHVIKAFLTTKSGSEGISLMNVRQVHIMEPYWNNILVEQAIARAIRRCSHITLPEKEIILDILKLYQHNFKFVLLKTLSLTK